VLQLNQEEITSTISNGANSSLGGSLISVMAPQQISSDQILVVQANLSLGAQSTPATRLVAFDSSTGQIEAVVDISSIGAGQRMLDLLLSPPYNSSEISLQLIVLRDMNGVLMGGATSQTITTRIISLLTVTLGTTASNISLTFDGNQYAVSGSAEITTTRGTHTVQAPPVVYLSNQSRVVFTQWEDGSSSVIRQVSIDSNTTLVAYYRNQYFVNATSTYGSIAGSGWYDENSTATVFLRQPTDSGRNVIFSHWTGDSNESSPRVLLLVNSPKNLQAGWEKIVAASEPDLFGIFVIVSPSVIIFTALLVLNLKKRNQALS
jgi:hypothetical protein